MNAPPPRGGRIRQWERRAALTGTVSFRHGLGRRARRGRPPGFPFYQTAAGGDLAAVRGRTRELVVSKTQFPRPAHYGTDAAGIRARRILWASEDGSSAVLFCNNGTRRVGDQGRSNTTP